MRVYIMLLSLLSCLAGSRVWADGDAIKVMSAAEFQHLKPSDLSSNTIYYSSDVMAFEDWIKRVPVEAEFLNLYPGYSEPTVQIEENGIQRPYLEKLTMFVSSARVKLEQPAEQIDFKKFVDIDTIRKLDPEIRHVQIGPNQVISQELGKGPIHNFNWCQDGGSPVILRVQKETDLSYINPPDRKWCSDSRRSLCLESCYVFNYLWHQGVAAYNLTQDEDEQKDYGIGMQSEMTYFTSEADLHGSSSVQALTGIATPVRGGIVQNLFYFNQVMEFGKIFAVLQDDPQNPNQSVASIYFVIALKTRTYNKNPLVSEILMGGTMFNTNTGITAGLPTFTQNMIRAVTQAL